MVVLWMFVTSVYIEFECRYIWINALFYLIPYFIYYLLVCLSISNAISMATEFPLIRDITNNNIKINLFFPIHTIAVLSSTSCVKSFIKMQIEIVLSTCRSAKSKILLIPNSEPDYWTLIVDISMTSCMCEFRLRECW